MKKKKTKKGLFTMIRESMTKTGGCCGPGETCCGPEKKDDNATVEDTKGSDKDDKK